MAQSETAPRRSRPVGPRRLTLDLRCRIALALLGKSGAAKTKLADFLLGDGRYRGPIVRLNTRTLVACGDHYMWVSNQDEGVGRGLLKHGAWQRDDFETALRLIVEHRGRDNFSLNELSIDLEIVRKAAGDGTRIVSLKQHPTDAGMHVVVEAPGAQTIEVELDTLPNILGGLGVEPEDIDFIWMDVEGHEFEVFKRMDRLLLNRTPVFFEYSRWAIADKRHDWAKKFSALGYRCWVMKRGGRAHETDFDDALSIEFGNILLL